MDNASSFPTVGDIGEAPCKPGLCPRARSMVRRSAERDADETQRWRIGWRSLEGALGTWIVGEVRMDDFMPPSRQVPTQLDLERMAGIVMDNASHSLSVMV